MISSEVVPGGHFLLTEWLAVNAFPQNFMSVQDCKLINKNGKVPTFQLQQR